VPVTIDFAQVKQDDVAAKVAELCDELEAADAAGWYGALTVERPWSRHNPVLEGEFACPRAIRPYLERELGRLAAAGARISAEKKREALDLHDPALLAQLDEGSWDLRRKKLFLFRPERMSLSIDRLAHYTGTPAEAFQRYVLFTNYSWHVEAFRQAFPDAIGPAAPGRQMPAWHATRPGRDGITLVDIGVGPSNAKTITDHVAVLRPDLMLMIGHCGGLRNHQDVGDLVLAMTYLRSDGVLDHVLPRSIPVASNHRLNTYLLDALVRRDLPYRLGTVYTTANRNWEFDQATVLEEIRLSRAIAVDMESATVAANGFRYRIPTATLLAVSDKPLHGTPKLAEAAQGFYQATRQWHLDVALEVVERVRKLHPDGLPAADVRSPDEPLLGRD
jgi:AMP nucleosidase